MLLSAVAGLLAATATLPSALGAAVNRPTDAEYLAQVIAMRKRGLPNAPNGYTPTTVTCPDNRPTIRDASGLSTNETDWLELRRNATVEPMKELLGRMNITGVDIDTYIANDTALPNIGIAVSGGGYRALQNGAGALAAYDSRSSNSTGTGQLGGLLQSATYLAGLSGGGWLVASLYTNNFTSVQSIMNDDTADEGSLWQFGNNIFEGPDDGKVQIVDTAEYWDTMHDEVDGKEDAGWNITITDYWGRALSFQLINATDGGPSYTWSSIAQQDFFTNGSVPFPILVSDSRAPGEVVVDGNATIFEYNVFELGSFDPTTYAFAPMEYIGSNFSGGVVPSNGSCVRGYDNAGYVLGSSSTLFNEFLLDINSTDIPTLVEDALTDILDKIGEDDDDIADWPNPFIGYNVGTNDFSSNAQLTLVDGGEDGQNIPLHPLIQPERALDVIFAVDSSADTSSPAAANWPNGTSLVASYDRSLLSIANGTSFPYIPDQQTFVNLGLNKRPTFFGCDNNSTNTFPLIVYVPNAPYSYFSNVSTADLEYNDTERNLIIQNGWNVATMGNGSVDSTWPTCVGCAILQRSFNRTNTTIPDVCTTCFDTYCWSGVVNDTTTNYDPTYITGEATVSTKKSAAIRSAAPTFAISAALVAASVLLL